MEHVALIIVFCTILFFPVNATDSRIACFTCFLSALPRKLFSLGKKIVSRYIFGEEEWKGLFYPSIFGSVYNLARITQGIYYSIHNWVYITI